MRLRRLLKFLTKPFENLNALDRLIQIIRLSSSIVVLSMLLVLTLGSRSLPTLLYMGRLNTSSIDIAQGLFDVLQESVESYTASNINNGVGLTTSEILILTEYTASQIKEVPRYVVTSVYGWCKIHNETTEVDNSGDLSESATASNKTVCFEKGAAYILDYRQLLETIGLDIILNYAYGDSSGASSAYLEYISQNKQKKERMINLMYFVTCTQFFMIILQLWYYSIKGKSLNVLKEQLLVHGISFISLLIFVCTLIAVINLAIINLSLRSRVESELETFGMSYHLGGSWFTVLWLFAIFSCISCLVWSGLEWCVSDRTKNSDNFELGVTATANPSTEEEESTTIMGPLLPRSTSQLLKPPPVRGQSSKVPHLEISDSESIALQKTKSTDSELSNLSQQNVVVPLSAFPV